MSVFDGMSSLLTGIFGAPVSITPAGGATVVVPAVFRDEPVEVDAADGRGLMIPLPTLQVPRDSVPGLAAGDAVSVSGRQFRILTVARSASPASDGFLVCELEEV